MQGTIVLLEAFSFVFPILQDNVEQIKGEIQRMELMKQTMPAKTRRNSTGNKAAEAGSALLGFVDP